MGCLNKQEIVFKNVISNFLHLLKKEIAQKLDCKRPLYLISILKKYGIDI